MRVVLAISVLFAAIAAAHGAQPSPEVLLPPIPPSPIVDFRRWLDMAESDREAALAGYPEEKRVILRQKIRAYTAMPEDQRERRLKMLELRWYLRPLMRTDPDQRGNYLTMVPPRLHELVRGRLAQWDQLDAGTRREILANDEAREMAMRYFVQIHRTQTAPQDLRPMNSAQRAELQQKLEHWRQTTPTQRERMARQLSSFFELPRPDQERTLERFSETDRQEMQKTLEAFGRLSADHRRLCVESFQKFATMSPQERGEFLRKAERWQQMTAHERETWKNLVRKLPPMPPTPVEFPPLPRTQGSTARRLADGSSGGPVP